MLKYYNWDIVFQEIPDETTLAINITECPFRCEGCHSPHLREDIGEPLTREALSAICERYKGDYTCVAIMGGDARPADVQEICSIIKNDMGLKSAWYSGAAELPEGFDLSVLDFVKIGPYREAEGGLKSENTNQRLYSIDANGTLTDITAKIREKHLPLQ